MLPKSIHFFLKKFNKGAPNLKVLMYTVPLLDVKLTLTLKMGEEKEIHSFVFCF